MQRTVWQTLLLQCWPDMRAEQIPHVGFVVQVDPLQLEGGPTCICISNFVLCIFVLCILRQSTPFRLRVAPPPGWILQGSGFSSTDISSSPATSLWIGFTGRHLESC